MNDEPLSGRGVLVTRPREQSRELVEAIRNAGGIAIAFPVIEIVPRPGEDVARDAAALPDPDIVVYVSTNAVEHGFALHADRDARVAAIGPATAAAIERAGGRVDIRSEQGFDSEALLETEALLEVDGKRVRIVRGEGGRELLGDSLRERGAEVDYLAVYRRLPVERSAADLRELLEFWSGGGIAAVVVMSVETFTNLRDALPPEGRRLLESTPVVTPSRRVIKTASEKIPGSRAILAAGPQTADLLQALIAATSRDSEMSDKTNEQSETPAQKSDATVAEETAAGAHPAAGDAAADSYSAAAAADGRRGLGISAVAAWLALLLALAGLAGTGYLYLQDRGQETRRAGADASIAALSGNLDDTVDTVGSLRGRIEELADSETRYARELETLERQLDRLLERFEALPARITSLEDAMSSLQGISTSARDTWWLAEAEYYMQLANAQLQLAGNPELAKLALDYADQRIRQMANPALTDVRRALARELRALSSIERPDIDGVSLALSSLADDVSSLPLQQDIPRAGAANAVAAGDEEGAGRAWAAIKRAFRDVVSVRRTDEEVTPLLSPEAVYFLRANLALQMQTARLALLRGERSVYEESLADAIRWLRQYFDTDSRAVESALQTLAEAREAYVEFTPPDISESLRLLRQHRNRLAQEAPVTSAPDESAE